MQKIIFYIKKRAQVTIFIILAIAIVIGAGIFFYANGEKMQSTVVEPVRSEVSENLKPMQQFFQDCLGSIGREAIIQLGQHGGYVDPADAYLSGRVFEKNPYKQYESDMAYLSSNDPNTAVAYWYYGYKSRNVCENCVVMSQAPYVSEMQRQLSIYVSENMEKCLNNFSSFQSMGYQIQHADFMNITASITANDVIFQADYPVTVMQGNSRSSMNKYYSRVDIPLLKYYLMALNITVNAYNNHFLESFDLFMIDSFSGLDTKKLPPTYAQTEGYDIKFWTQTGVKNMFKDILTSYVPLLQVPGTKNYRQINSQVLTTYEKNLYKSLSLDFFNGQNMKKTEINFLYLGQDIYMKVLPSNGELIGPKEFVQDTNSMLPESKSNIYNFYYTLSYPVIVQIKDEYAPNQSYTFLFALQSNLINNLNHKDWWNDSANQVYWDPSFLKVKINDLSSGAKIPAIVNNKPVNYTYKSRTNKNMFCDELQKVSGNITLRTFEAINKRPLSDVTVTFGCGNYMSCNIGITKMDYSNGFASLEDRLPICTNGYLRVEKQGYSPQNIPISTQIGVKNNPDIYMDPIVTKQIKVRKYLMNRLYAQTGFSKTFIKNIIANSSVALSKNESVIFTITKINSSELDEPFSQTAIIGRDSNSNVTTIDLTSGRYLIRAQLVDYNGVIVHKECKTICKDKSVVQAIFGGCEEEKIPKEDIIISPAVWGGIEFLEKTPFIVTKPDLLSNKSLEFYVIRVPDPRCLDDLQEPAQIPSLTSTYRAMVLPRFK